MIDGAKQQVSRFSTNSVFAALMLRDALLLRFGDSPVNMDDAAILSIEVPIQLFSVTRALYIGKQEVIVMIIVVD
jgi:hypothetical protein